MQFMFLSIYCKFYNEKNKQVILMVYMQAYRYLGAIPIIRDTLKNCHQITQINNYLIKVSFEI